MTIRQLLWRKTLISYVVLIVSAPLLAFFATYFGGEYNALIQFVLMVLPFAAIYAFMKKDINCPECKYNFTDSQQFNFGFKKNRVKYCAHCGYSLNAEISNK